jgi:hypothetical protein
MRSPEVPARLGLFFSHAVHYKAELAWTRKVLASLP